MNLNIELPQDLYEQAQQIADAQHLRVDDVLASAFADQLCQLRRLQEKARQGSREDLLRILDKVPDVEPEEYDRL